MSSELVKNIIYIIVFLISDLFGYRILPINTSTNTNFKLGDLSPLIKITTSSLEFLDNSRIKIENESLTITLTSTLKETITSTFITSTATTYSPDQISTSSSSTLPRSN